MHFTLLDMAAPAYKRLEFVPIASIVAFVFIGLVFLVGLIGRCLALNQSTVRSSQSLDLMIYQAPPKATVAQPRIRSSLEVSSHLTDIPITPILIQRGPKNL